MGTRLKSTAFFVCFAFSCLAWVMEVSNRESSPAERTDIAATDIGNEAVTAESETLEPDPPPTRSMSYLSERVRFVIHRLFKLAAMFGMVWFASLINRSFPAAIPLALLFLSLLLCFLGGWFLPSLACMGAEDFFTAIDER